MNTTQRDLSIIVARALRGAIGINGSLPWNKLREDMQRFRRITIGHPVIMGRKNWESIPLRFRPLADRTNIVLTHQQHYEAKDAIVVHDMDDAYAAAKKSPGGQEIFVIGGAEIYDLFVPFVSKMYVTTVETELEGDTYFRFPLTSKWRQVSSEEVPRDEKNQYASTYEVFERVDM